MVDSMNSILNAFDTSAMMIGRLHDGTAIADIWRFLSLRHWTYVAPCTDQYGSVYAPMCSRSKWLHDFTPQIRIGVNGWQLRALHDKMFWHTRKLASIEENMSE